MLFSFPHALGAPGIGWTAWNQVDGLARLGHDIHVVAASVARPVPSGVRVTETLAIGGKRIPHRAVGRDRAFAWHDARAARLVADGGYDLVHLWPTGPGRTAQAARAQRIAVVREAPNTHTEYAWKVVGDEVAALGLAGEVDTAHTANALRLRMEQADWEAATAILAPSDFVARTFREAGFSDDRILRHRYGFLPGSRRTRPRSASAAPLRAVYVGLGEPRKGLHYALEAWLASEASRDGTFTIVGRMLPAYAELLAPQLAHPSVRVIGFSHHVDAALAASDVLLLPTIEEGSALVTYEAQAQGCVPLVSTASGAVLDDGVHGFFHTPRDVASLTDHLDLVARDREALARMSAAAIDHSAQLTWDAAARVLADCYESARERANMNGTHAWPR
ncbi:glycosyltransferase family 4 protein [Microbacterium sp. SORGH_AS_0344]|uniref:glycosyltransferase family 4 protein n=1 Tax=Microbacterium sp. SORGH_AS_0344 TaxID=3041767 RepID=UPI0027D8DECC|nr:glycosyltransferase family 4 protein [Microbacterium sp. SORGH_AS_0344]